MKYKDRNYIRDKNGNILMIVLVFVMIAFVIFTFISSVFMSHINSILYNLKLDMYTLNRSAILAVNKNEANIDDFSYNVKAYKEAFVKGLKADYELDETLRNKDKLITSINIEEYEIYENRKIDNYTGEKCDDRVIHTVLKVKIKPIILKSVFEDIFIFTVHEDVNLNTI